MKRIIKNNYKIMIGFMLGILLSVTSVYAIEAYIESNKVSYDNKYTDKNNVQEAIDELYERSGIHKEKWVDPVLNGADPVLKSPLIPVEIKSNGDVYYANENSEWYNYSEKRWANAVILIDNPSNNNYQVGDHIIEDDIESYFVWIPRYKYKIWDLGEYTTAYLPNDLTNDKDKVTKNETFWKVAGSNSIIIDIVFGDYNYVKTEGNTKQGSGISGGDAGVNVGDYLIHPAFTLGDKNLNGFWVGKFETGYKGATSVDKAQVNNIEPNNIIIKPDVYSWRNGNVKNFFMTAYEYKAEADEHNEEINPHLIKNTEWGAVAYLSHSEYGIGTQVNINNASDYKTGYSASSGTDQRSVLHESVPSSNEEKSKKWNSSIGYLASTTGNISGIYDMSGGAWEIVAGCLEGGIGNSGFDESTLAMEIKKGYIDKYDKTSDMTTYNKRILGDATGELGPFYSYNENDGSSRDHNNWYSDQAHFPSQVYPWFLRGGGFDAGVLSGQFLFARYTGIFASGRSFRISLSPIK